MKKKLAVLLGVLVLSSVGFSAAKTVEDYQAVESLKGGN